MLVGGTAYGLSRMSRQQNVHLLIANSEKLRGAKFYNFMFSTSMLLSEGLILILAIPN